MSAAGPAFTGSWHVQDDTWKAVDAYTLCHTHSSARPNTAALRHALIHSRDSGLPDIAPGPVIAKFFALQCKARQTKHALELGTLGAYTSIWLATENPKLEVTSIEIHDHHADIAEVNIKYAGVADRVKVFRGAGLDVLPGLVEDIKSGKRPPFGFVYIDADKTNNWNYLNLVIEACEPGATIFVDNIVRGGKLVDPKEQETPPVLGAKQVVEMASKDDRIDCNVVQFVGEKGYDGFLMAVVT